MFDHGFRLDEFQRSAFDALDAGLNVLVAAPTGAGKTVVAEHAVELALSEGAKCFYTAPIKALSNQKFNDLRAVLGDDRVGLLTGDHAINGDAPVVVMTTEVLRNMVYAESPALEGLRWVVLDEVHFLQDAYRGPVWEEVLIHSPRHAGFVCLSATVSNAVELGEWITALRGPTEIVVEHQRPIRLDPLMLVGDRSAERDHLVPLLVDGRTNPEGHRFDADQHRQRQADGRRRRSRFVTPRRLETVERLDDEGLLPAIYFIFSRNGCDEAARGLLDAGVRLTNAGERTRIRAIAERRTAALGDDDLDVLGYDRWLATLEAGVAAHHAGMIPAFRETVEECFNQGILKVVFATETLAVGINMPARSVVIERLSKFNGERHEFLTPGQFTQLTGRAGRRGIDETGSAVVLWNPFAPFEQVANLAASREFPLSSSFRPTYNMSANLVERYDPDEAHEVLARSFAQFQADRSVVRLRARQDRLRGELEALRAEPERVSHQVFDVAGYAAIEEAVREQRRSRRSGGRAAVESSLRSLRPGDVIERRTPKGHKLLVVLAVSHRRGGAVRVRATNQRANLVTLDAGSVGEPVVAVGRVDLPRPNKPQDPKYRRIAATALRTVDRSSLRRPDREGTDGGAGRGADHEHAPDGDPGAVASGDPRDALEAHPLHHHPDRKALLAAHAETVRLVRDIDDIEREITRRGAGLVARFDAVVEVLGETGHVETDPVEGWRLTPAGQRLRRIYHECDLLISLALEGGLLDGLEPAELAAMLSCLTYEHRSAEPPPEPILPTMAVRDRHRALLAMSKDLHRLERQHRVVPTREPEGGFAAAAWSWASGQALDHILDEDLTGGDFVRNVRQLVDLLSQVALVAPVAATRAAARSASDALVRGVIAASSAPDEGDPDDGGPDEGGPDDGDTPGHDGAAAAP